MNKLNGRLRLRPTRIGFLVSPTNIGATRRILQVCSCMWGGVFNPIIPVTSEMPAPWESAPYDDITPDELTKGYLDFFEPDVFVECEPGLAAQAGLKSTTLDYGQPRVVPLAAFFEHDKDKRPRLPFGLNISDVYQDIFDREFKFVRRQNQRVVFFDRGTASDAFIDAAFGSFPEDGFLSPLAKNYTQAFQADCLAPTPDNWIQVVREHHLTPLRLTLHDIEREPDSYPRDLTLFVLDPNSPLDLIDLWNARQFKPNVLPVNFEWLNETQAYLREIVSASYRPLPGNPHGVMLYATVQLARSLCTGKARDTIVGLFQNLPQGSWSLQPSYEQICRIDASQDMVFHPRHARVTAAQTALELALPEDSTENALLFHTLSPKFASTYGEGEARWVNVLKLNSYFPDKPLAFVLPSDFTNNNPLRLRLAASALVSREGIVLPQQFKNHQEYLTLPSGTDAILEWLKARGIEAKRSRKGNIADQVLNSLGGFLRAGLLADRETLFELDDMAKSAKKYADGRVEEYPDRSEPVTVWQGLIHRRNNTRRFAKVTLDSFIKASILRLGLSVECPNCSHRNWYSLETVAERTTCDRCLKAFDFPQGTLDFRNTWHYRVIGPFAVPDFAEGAYATILALRVFARQLGHDAQLTYSTNLEITLSRQEERPNEIDFAFWYSRDYLMQYDEEPVLVFGEAKSFAAESFQQKDIERMECLAAVFPGAFLVFATLKDNLSEGEKSSIAKLALWGRRALSNGRQRAPVVVLTATEMFSDWDIRQSWQDAGGQRAQFAAQHLQLQNLWNLSDATQQLYLGLPDRYSWLTSMRQ